MRGKSQNLEPLDALRVIPFGMDSMIPHVLCKEGLDLTSSSGNPGSAGVKPVAVRVGGFKLPTIPQLPSLSSVNRLPLSVGKWPQGGIRAGGLWPGWLQEAPGKAEMWAGGPP